MSCRKFRGQTPLAVGHDLPADQQRTFDEHLRGCLSCYREYRDHADALAALNPLRAPASFDAPDGLVDAIIAGVWAAEPGPLAPHPTPFWARPSRTIRYGLPLAATVLIFSLAGLYLSMVGGEPQGRVPQIPPYVSSPTLRPISNTPDDEIGPVYVFPERFHPGRLRHVGPASLRWSEPLPPAAVPISERNDF
ncbi:MAG: hypothetical protein V2A76_14925 [Planctomycetota bacterium]